ncbi:hypothetical protein [Mucilaginibacter xinganensis]|uniref:Uncharacterized protein n=1 Tax=Mucilaginibacter xinganensis TaxID=1234841 RepID=A0A223P2S3_9SPHI|nr:hypothetical protein [Mucilaginibacter xinganensis]ASU36340.1 hypothetical protein MuYL_4455 [Mucilaginibacter xinganensis]
MKAQKKTAVPSPMSYNEAVRHAYDQILKKATQLLAALEQEELRYVLERTQNGSEPPIILHELVSPIVYLRLECVEDSKLVIHFGAEPSSPFPEVQAVTAGFLRTLFTLTGKAYTGVNVEDCVKTDWLINVCSEMFEYLEGRTKYHTFRRIPYKKRTPQRKRVLAVA